MPRLPGEADLGPAPAITPTRPSGDPSAGYAARAAGGQALAQGLDKLGAGVQSLAASEDQWDYAKAKSSFLTDLTNVQTKTSESTDYAADDSGETLTQRHAAAVQAAQDRAAALVRRSGAREHFLLETNPLVAKSNAAAEKHARTLEFNASAAYTVQQGEAATKAYVATDDDETRKQIVDGQNQLIDGLVAKGLLPLDALKMKRAAAIGFHTADLQAAIESNDPQRIQAVINRLRAVPASAGTDGVSGITQRIISDSVEGRGQNPRSSAVGTGQFIDSTWLDVLKRNRPDLAAGRSDAELLALRSDPKLGAQMTEAYRRENVTVLKRAGIVDPTPGEQYLAHFLGPAGATAAIKADPDRPIADVLTEAVGAKKAAAMIAANPTVLQGKLTGSVRRWADGKMGGVASHGAGDEILPETTRLDLLMRAEGALAKHGVNDRAMFAARVRDAEAEAMATGSVTSPIAPAEFVQRYGQDDGERLYREHEIAVETGRTVNGMAIMTPEQRQRALEALAPTPGGPDFAVKAKGYQVALTAAQRLATEMHKDAGGFAIARLPAAREAFTAYQGALADPTVPLATKQQAARHFAEVTLMEQRRVGVAPSDVRILPDAAVDALKARIEDPGADGGSANVAQRIAAEAQLWGQNWPLIYRDIAKKAGPIVRVVGAGVTPYAGRVLTELGQTSLGDILKDKDENDAKTREIKSEVLTAFKPFAASLAGAENGLSIFNDFRGQAEKFAAYLVVRGASPSDAAQRAFDELVGHKYAFISNSVGGGIFSDAPQYRVPKDIGIAPATIETGARIVRQRLGALASGASGSTAGGAPSIFQQAVEQYPIVGNAGVNVVTGHAGAGDDRKLEFWQPGDRGTPSSPRPAGLPLEKPGVELLSGDVKPSDVAADITSHYLVNSDPKLKGIYQQLERSFETPEGQARLREDYRWAQQHESGLYENGKLPPFEQWVKQTRMPAYFRGYVFHQWSDSFVNQAFTADQKSILDNAAAYLSKPRSRTSDGGPLPAFADVAVPSDNFGGVSEASRRSAALSSYARDGIWVTAPGDAGLMMIYRDQAVRMKNGQPLVVTWKELAGLADQSARSGSVPSIAPGVGAFAPMDLP